MTEPFQYNSVVNSSIDNILAEIMPKFNREYILSTIEFAIENRIREFNQQHTPNIVYGFDLQFNSLMNDFESNQDSIIDLRSRTYANIIDILCDKFELEPIYQQDQEIDMYLVTLSLYDFLVSKFTYNLVDFFARFLINNKESIVTMVDNTNTDNNALNYSKKIFDDPDIALIHCNIFEILKNMGSIGITLEDIIDTIYNNGNTQSFIKSIVRDTNNFYMNFYYNTICDPIWEFELTIMIKMQIQALVGNSLYLPANN